MDKTLTLSFHNFIKSYRKNRVPEISLQHLDTTSHCYLLWLACRDGCVELVNLLTSFLEIKSNEINIAYM